METRPKSEPSTKILSDDERSWLCWACGFTAGAYLERSVAKPEDVQRARNVAEKLREIAFKIYDL